MSDTQEKLQAGEEGPLKTMWLETHLGDRYELPSMLAVQISAAHSLLDWSEASSITLVNISEAVLVVPKRVIKRAGVGERCFWEAE